MLQSCAFMQYLKCNDLQQENVMTMHPLNIDCNIVPWNARWWLALIVVINRIVVHVWTSIIINMAWFLMIDSQSINTVDSAVNYHYYSIGYCCQSNCQYYVTTTTIHHHCIQSALCPIPCWFHHPPTAFIQVITTSSSSHCTWDTLVVLPTGL